MNAWVIKIILQKCQPDLVVIYTKDLSKKLDFKWGEQD